MYALAFGYLPYDALMYASIPALKPRWVWSGAPEMRDSLDIIDSTAVELTIGPWLMAKWSGYLQRSNIGDVFSGHSAETAEFSRLP